MVTDILKINRFTTIPFLLDLLQREKLTLLNPSSWEDYNDKETVEAFKKRSGFSSVYALCLTYGNETVHHWNAFANGTSGCCIEFSPEKLFKILDALPNVSHGKASYMSIKQLRDFTSQELPYFKRLPFKPEREYRIIATSDQSQKPALDIGIDLSIIRRITISNKVPPVVFKSLKKIIADINPSFSGKIIHSTLFNNQIWINHFKSDTQELNEIPPSQIGL